MTRREWGTSILAEQEQEAAVAAAAAPATWFASVMSGDVKAMQAMLKGGQDVNARDSESQRAALDIAAAKGDRPTVKLLLQAGAKLDAPDLLGVTPLMAAVRGGHEDLALLLLERGASPNQVDVRGTTILVAACERGSVALVKRLLQAGAKATWASPTSGLTPLLVACQRGDAELVRLLLAAGADATATRGRQPTALHLAARQGHAEIVAALLQAKADPNARAELGETPLTLAARGGQLDAVRLLLDAGADVNTINSVGQTPLFLAQLGKHAPVAALLLERGAKAADQPLLPTLETAMGCNLACQQLRMVMGSWRREEKKAITDVPTFAQLERFLPADSPVRARQGKDLLGNPIHIGNGQVGVRLHPDTRAALRPLFKTDAEEAAFWGEHIRPLDGPPKPPAP